MKSVQQPESRHGVVHFESRFGPDCDLSAESHVSRATADPLGDPQGAPIVALDHRTACSGMEDDGSATPAIVTSITVVACVNQRANPSHRQCPINRSESEVGTVRSEAMLLDERRATGSLQFEAVDDPIRCACDCRAGGADLTGRIIAAAVTRCGADTLRASHRPDAQPRTLAASPAAHG